jgi:hypothetical protein
MTDFPKIPNKYRRAFNWRISHATADSLETETTATFRLATSDFPDILEDFLEISRKRMKNWTALSRLQLHMIEELLIQEAAVKHYKARLAELEGTSTQTSAHEPRTQEIEHVKRELHFYRRYANAVRVIGDGIAWRALEYDRAVTRALSEHATKQTIAAEGTLQELNEWLRHFERGTGLAIFNALTNCLAVGDVTVVRPDESVEIIEVKSSNVKSGRKVRQRQEMTEIVTQLSTGEGRIEDRKTQIEILPVTPETGLDRVEELLKVASAKAWAAAKISNCLYVEAFDFRRIAEVPSVEELKRRVDAARDAIVGDWERRGDFVSDLSSLDFVAFSPNCAPFSIFPFAARTCVDLLVGATYYMAYLNLTAVGREFENRGWSVEQVVEQLKDESDREIVMRELRQGLMRVSKGGLHIHLAAPDFTRMQIEALRAKTLIETCEATHRLGPRAGGFSQTVFRGESEIWN